MPAKHKHKHHGAIDWIKRQPGAAGRDYHVAKKHVGQASTFVAKEAQKAIRSIGDGVHTFTYLLYAGIGLGFLLVVSMIVRSTRRS
jgi:hypothetical protein